VTSPATAIDLLPHDPINLNLIKGKECLKVENKGGEKTDSSNNEFGFVEEYKLASRDDDFEENKLAHGNENEHIEEVMNQKGNKLRKLINKPLSDEDSNKINQIIKNKEVKSGEMYIHYNNKKVSWGSMRRLLSLDTTEKNLAKRWINNKVINFYFKKYLAEMDQK
jgi:hypothetical protein